MEPMSRQFMFVIDADTSVAPDSLNRLVAASTDDSQIIGICGETRLENEQASWWTMIQGESSRTTVKAARSLTTGIRRAVYEYFISHHMAKAFESLFGSVTCLPGWCVRSENVGLSTRLTDDRSSAVSQCIESDRPTRANPSSSVR